MAGRPRNTETDRIAKELAVSKRRAEQLRSQNNGAQEGNEMRASRLKKLNAEVAKPEFQLEILKRNYVPSGQAEAYALRIGQVVERFWDEGRTNWPTEHAGKTELQLQILYDNIESGFKERLRAAIAHA